MIPIPDKGVSKILGISGVIRMTPYANENDQVHQLQDGRGHQKDPGLIRRLEFSAPSPASGWGEGLKIELNTSGQGFNPSYPQKETLR